MPHPNRMVIKCQPTCSFYFCAASNFFFFLSIPKNKKELERERESLSQMQNVRREMVVMRRSEESINQTENKLNQITEIKSNKME